jgi:hypothetical protein
MIFLNIIWPTFALVALIFVVWFTLFVQRSRHMRQTPPRGEDFANHLAATRYFEPVEGAGNNLRNLFEMPVLFFALVPLLMITRQVDLVQVVLAWMFVLTRATHSFIHITTKAVWPRFLVYLLSSTVLLAMWIGFAVDMAAAAHAYHEAMKAMGPQP